MSISNNTPKLQSLLDKINALPEAENLDEEISTQTALLTEQDAKIAELAEVLAGKASGSSGDSIETCTVNISTNTSNISTIAYVTVNDNGEIESILNTTSSSSYSLNCLCGSMIVLYVANSLGYTATGVNDLGYIGVGQYTKVFSITATKNETATIIVTGGSGGSA